MHKESFTPLMKSHERRPRSRRFRLCDALRAQPNLPDDNYKSMKTFWTITSSGHTHRSAAVRFPYGEKRIHVISQFCGRLVTRSETDFGGVSLGVEKRCRFFV